MIDTSGEPLPVKSRVVDAEEFSGGLAVINSGHGNLHLLQRDGQPLPASPFSAVGPFHHGVSVVEQEGKAVLIDKTGKTLIVGSGKSFGPDGGRYLQVFKQTATDLIDLEGKIHVRVEGRTVRGVTQGCGPEGRGRRRGWRRWPGGRCPAGGRR